MMTSTNAVGGTFLLINHHLCLTSEDAEGSFCPADVFGGLSSALLTQSYVAKKEGGNAGASATIVGGLSRSAQNDEQDNLFSSSCPIFNTFGVLSGGVLIDALRGEFVDFTDSAPYTPGTIPGYSAAITQAQSATLVSHNNVLAAGSDFESIEATSALTLCSSIEPLQSVRVIECPETLLANPRARTYVIHRNCEVLRRRNVTTSLRRLVKPASNARRSHLHQYKKFCRLLELAEGFRQSLKSSQTVLHVCPRSIPFKFQCNGRPLALDSRSGCISSSGQDDTCVSTTRNVGRAPPCAAAIFAPYTGKTWFTLRKQGLAQSRDAVMELSRSQRECHAQYPMRIQAAFTPAPPWATIAMELPPVPTPQSTVKELRAYRLRAYRLFFAYRGYLGIVLDAPTVKGEGRATLSAQAERRTFRLRADESYSVSKEIERWRKDRIACQLKTAVNGAVDDAASHDEVLAPPQELLSPAMVVDAWDYLWRHHRAQLMRRILRLDLYLRKVVIRRQERHSRATQQW